MKIFAQNFVFFFLIEAPGFFQFRAMRSFSSLRSVSTQFPALSAALVACLTGTALAQQSITLDGTSGSESSSGNHSTTGGLNISLNFNAEYLVVGGGGGGAGTGSDGTAFGGGGGGAGGMKSGNMTLSNTLYNVAVGAGGAGGNKTSGGTAQLAQQGKDGGNSTFGDVSVLGGGGGGRYKVVGNVGGSGGGGGGRGNFNNDRTLGGNGTVGQGNAGGATRDDDSLARSAGGGGGGAGAVGGTGGTNVSVAGNGGVGLSSNITGSSVFYAGGGGGGALDDFDSETAGTGGNGGGGAGSISGNATAGTDGRGGGGGGAGTNGWGGDGGDGIVIVRYKGSSLGNIGGTVTSGNGTAAGYTLHTFTTAGNSSFDMSSVDMNSRLGATISGVISGAGNLTFSGPGTLSLGAANTFTGETRAAAGTLSLNHANALAGSTLNLASSDNGTVTFGMTGFNTYNVAGIIGSKNLALAGNTLSVGSNNANSVYSGALSGAGGFTKVGNGTLTLTGNNTSFTGDTIVSSGGLVVNGDLSNSDTTVQSGSYLGGSGSVGALSVANGGSIAPGNSPGILETGNLDLQGEIEMEIAGTAAGTEYDQIDVTGTVTLGATSTLSVTLLNSFAPVNDDLIFILSNDGIDAITGTFSGLAHLSTFFVGDTEWQISYLANYAGSSSGTFLGGNDIALMAIPEPSAALLGGLGALMLLRRRRA